MQEILQLVARTQAAECSAFAVSYKAERNYNAAVKLLHKALREAEEKLNAKFSRGDSVKVIFADGAAREGIFHGAYSGRIYVRFYSDCVSGEPLAMVSDVKLLRAD